MNIQQIKKLSSKPQLYERGSSVMWTDPHISKKLLELHINPDIDIASRSKSKIERITNWILSHMDKPKLKILDLGCGPGLYAELLAQKSHSVIGVDFSANSIQYATRQAQEKQLDIEYLNKNYLDLDYVNQFDLFLMIYLDFCVLLPDERDQVAEIVNELLKENLIDELLISVIPILVGNGKRLFKDNRPEQKLNLVNVKTFDTGLTQLHYTCIDN